MKRRFSAGRQPCCGRLLCLLMMAACVHTSLQAQQADWVNVRDFGANPDDDRDDTQAFEAAIAAARNRGLRIWIPAGTSEKGYIISRTVTFFSPEHVFGAWQVKGAGTADMAYFKEQNTVIRYTGRSGPCFNFRGLRLADISGFTMVGNNRAPPAHGRAR